MSFIYFHCIVVCQTLDYLSSQFCLLAKVSFRWLHSVPGRDQHYEYIPEQNKWGSCSASYPLKVREVNSKKMHKQDNLRCGILPVFLIFPHTKKVDHVFPYVKFLHLDWQFLSKVNAGKVSLMLVLTLDLTLDCFWGFRLFPTRLFILKRHS